MPIAQYSAKVVRSDHVTGLDPEPELVTDPVVDVGLDQIRKDEDMPAIAAKDDLVDDLEEVVDDLEDGEDLDTEESLSLLIRLFLHLNPEPSDEQVHSLAYSLGLSKEALEELIYSMLSDELDDDDEEDDEEDDDEDEELDEELAAFIHSPIIDPQNADEEMVNDGREGDRP